MLFAHSAHKKVKKEPSNPKNGHFCMKKRIILFILIFACASLVVPLHSMESASPAPREKWFTIFVHGIISVKPHLNVHNIIRLMRDDIANTVYARAVEIMRKDDFFYKYHAMQEVGLLPVNINSTEPGAAASVFARAFDTVAKFANPNMPQHEYYTFGWSGLLSQYMWNLEAELFYKKLHDLVATTRAQGYEPRIRMVGYSHGGTFALHLALFDSGFFSVDEMWLIGVPVLPSAYDLIKRPFFKKIDHFYSYGDRVQPLDCFGFNRFFSDRAFYPTAKNPLPEKLTQIQMKFRRPVFAQKTCPIHKNGCTKINRSRMRNADPGHTELWSFGWSPASYRSNFPLNPLPATVCLPFFAQTIANERLHGTHTSIEVYSNHEFMMISGSTIKKTIQTSFLPDYLLNALKQDALACRPINYHPQLYGQKVQQAIARAQIDHENEKKAARATRSNRSTN